MSSTLLERDVAIAPRPTTRWRRRLAVSAAAVALAAGAVYFGLDWWTNGRFIESTDDAYVGGDVTPIAPHVAGFVAEVLVRDNQHIAAGAPIFRLDPRDFRAALDRAEAIVQERQAALSSLQAQLALQQATIHQAEAELQARTARADFAAEDARRYASLAQTAAGSRQDQQRTTTASQEAQSAVLAADAALTAARRQVSVLESNVQAAQAAIAEARADATMARLNLGYTEVTSPIDGYVGNRAARVGAYVTSGTYLASIIPAHGLWVDANFKEDQLARIRVGQPAEVVADAAPGHVVHGHVVSVAPGTGAVFSVIPPENATGNFTKIVQRVPIRIEFDAADAALDTLRPGLSTTVRVDTRGGDGK